MARRKSRATSRVSSAVNRSAKVRTAPTSSRPNMRFAILFTLVIWPWGSKEMTPLGMFSRMASMVFPRSSNWRLAAWSSLAAWSMARRFSRSCRVIALKEWISTPSSSSARVDTWKPRLPLDTSCVASARAWMGTVTCLERNKANQVAINRINRVSNQSMER